MSDVLSYHELSALPNRLMILDRIFVLLLVAAIVHAPDVEVLRPAHGQSSTATYSVAFRSTWSASTHPQDFPSNPHFSGLIGATHDPSVTFWSPGELASDGIENMAETGSKVALSSEINLAVDLGGAEFLLSGGGISVSPGQVVLEFNISEDFPLVTLVSMVAPSPDWFVGVSGLALFESGAWLQHVEIPLIVYDAGTDDGMTYTSPNADSDPPQAITELADAPFDVEQQVGTYVFELVQVVGVESAEVPRGLEEVRVYPNPASDMVFIDVPDGRGPVGVEVYDVLGRRVGRGDGSIAVDLSEEPPGLYVVRLTDGRHVETRPVVVTR